MCVVIAIIYFIEACFAYDLILLIFIFCMVILLECDISTVDISLASAALLIFSNNRAVLFIVCWMKLFIELS